ncbi:MAG: hypothetical protein AAGC55_01820 [Myxococcota bacterium]
MVTLAPACVMEEMDEWDPVAGEFDPDDFDGELGTITSTLCSDGAADVTLAYGDDPLTIAASSAQTSNNYDGPGCSDRFVVEVTGLNAATEPYFVIAGWGEGLPTNEGSCELAVANVQTHAYGMQFDCSGTFCVPVYNWSPVGNEITMRGNWIPFFDGGFCSLVPDQPLPLLQPSWFRSRVRVSVRAYGWAIFFPAYKRARAGIGFQPPPPQ